MLYNVNNLSKYKINTDDLSNYIKALSFKKDSTMFFDSWIKALINAYNSNDYDCTGAKERFDIQIVKLTDSCAFRLHYNVGKIIYFAKYYNVKTISADEFKKMNVLINKSAEQACVQSNMPLKNPLVVIADCPFGTEFKPVALTGTKNINERLERRMRIDYIKLPHIQTSMTLSQQFEQAWYIFIDEYNKYRELEIPIEQKRFFENSLLHKFL